MIIRNPLIPFPRFLAVNICGLIFTRRNVRLTPVDLNHERIHTRQMVETLFVGFYLWYVVEWLVRLAIVHNGFRAYHAIRFEREAYDHERDLDYLRRRRPYAWLRGNSPTLPTKENSKLMKSLHKST